MASIDEIALRKRGWRTDVASGSIQFIGTATTLIRYAGFTILTDPNFLHRGDHIHLGFGLRSRRLTDPAVEIGDLPKLDLVVVSHMHEDHFDRVAAAQLDRTIPIVTNPSAAQELAGMGFEAPKAVDKWETLTFRKGNIRLQITAMPARHGGVMVSKALPAVMGSMLEFRSSKDTLLMRLYISGDTLLFSDLKKIPERYPDIDVALLNLGGARIMGILLTMDGAQGVQAVKLLQPQVVIPLHFNDYTVFKSPLSDFQQRIKAEGLEDRVRYLAHGETYRWRVPKNRL